MTKFVIFQLINLCAIALLAILAFLIVMHYFNIVTITNLYKNRSNCIDQKNKDHNKENFKTNDIIGRFVVIKYDEEGCINLEKLQVFGMPLNANVAGNNFTLVLDDLIIDKNTIVTGNAHIENKLNKVSVNCSIKEPPFIIVDLGQNCIVKNIVLTKLKVNGEEEKAYIQVMDHMKKVLFNSDTFVIDGIVSILPGQMEWNKKKY